MVFQDFENSLTETVVYLYNVDKEKWLKIQCDFTKIMFESCEVLHLSFINYTNACLTITMRVNEFWISV